MSEKRFESISQLIDIGFAKFHMVFLEVPNTENPEMLAKDVIIKF